MVTQTPVFGVRRRSHSRRDFPGRSGLGGTFDSPRGTPVTDGRCSRRGLGDGARKWSFGLVFSRVVGSEHTNWRVGKDREGQGRSRSYSSRSFFLSHDLSIRLTRRRTSGRVEVPGTGPVVEGDLSASLFTTESCPCTDTRCGCRVNLSGFTSSLIPLMRTTQ